MSSRLVAGIAPSRIRLFVPADMGEDIPALLCGLTGRYQRAAAFGGLDDKHAQRQPADDAVAAAEVARANVRPHRLFADDGAAAVGYDALEQLGVFRRVRFAQAATHHGDGPPAGG